MLTSLRFEGYDCGCHLNALITIRLPPPMPPASRPDTLSNEWYNKLYIALPSHSTVFWDDAHCQPHDLHVQCELCHEAELVVLMKIAYTIACQVEPRLPTSALDGRIAYIHNDTPSA